MATLRIQDTAYPRLKSTVTTLDLDECYTPTTDELWLAHRLTRSSLTAIGFLITLKTVQRLGYFVPITEVPNAIVQHIAAQVQGTPLTPDDLDQYQQSNTMDRHRQAIRDHLSLISPGRATRRVMVQVMVNAARTKHHLADLINVALEELVRQQYELPPFATFVRMARRSRSLSLRQVYHEVHQHLTDDLRATLDRLLEPDSETGQIAWTWLKDDPGRPTLSHMRSLIPRLEQIRQWNIGATALDHVADIKVQHLAQEARSLDATRMREMAAPKRYTLAIAFVRVLTAQAHDDLATIFIRRMQTIHTKAEAALEQYRVEYRDRTDRLIVTLKDTVLAYRGEGNAETKLAAMDQVLGEQHASILADCEAHIAHTSHKYYPFLWDVYRSHRATLFRMLKVLTLRTTSQDRAMEQAIHFALNHERSRGEYLDTTIPRIIGQNRVKRIPLLSLTWIPEGWWRLVTEQAKRRPFPRQIHRRYFEVCLFTKILHEFKSGDLAVVGGDDYGDYRDQLISMEDYAAQVPSYGDQVGLPVDGEAFVNLMRTRLTQVATKTDKAFPSNQQVQIEHGTPVIRRRKPPPDPAGLADLEAQMAQRLTEINILDVLAATEQWLNWTRFFGPLSGHESKLENPAARYLATVFCFGCHLGPTQTARALRGISRRQLSYLNRSHITLEQLERANGEIINAYHRFALPRYWGSGASVSADGTQWDLYERNLLAEYHIRYGGYGGIGYYHVSDQYIALFSRFIPCGVWEAVYILDGLLQNKSDVQPTTVHADTQGQNEVVFGLATLLGIRLMPRIRDWKEKRFYRPTAETRYQHIEALFARESINWDLIQTHLPDMLRVVLSIKAGRITPSTLLKRLNSYSRKNKLYLALRELGRAVRTGFLLEYLADETLRTLIHAATNKSESFHALVQWLAFGGERVIRENDRLEQQKVIAYNHLVANCAIFYNVHAMSSILHTMQQEGWVLEDAAIAALSPYLRQHIDRFGRYHLNLNQPLPPLDFDLFVPPMTQGNPAAATPDSPAVQQLGLWGA